MYDNASPGKESRGYDQQPARIVLQNGETFDVIHHDRTADNRWVFAYVDSREDGIDYRFPSSSVAYIDTSSGEYERVEDDEDAPSTVITAGASPSEFEDDDSDDEDCELVTDGGFDRMANTDFSDRDTTRSELEEKRSLLNIVRSERQHSGRSEKSEREKELEREIEELAADAR